MKITLGTVLPWLVLTAIASTAGCSLERNNQLVKGYGDSGWVEETENVSGLAEKTEKKQQEIAEASKKQHGLMHIHRYGEGYDILLTLDAGDSDVKFVMALPDHNNDEQTDSINPEEASGEEEFAHHDRRKL